MGTSNETQIVGAPARHFSPIDEILEELRAGRMIVVVDDEERENEGDLCLPAQFITPEAVNFMIRAASGYLFLALSSRDCDRLKLDSQTPNNTSVNKTPFTVSIDGHPKHGFTTGVSASERARTIELAVDENSGPSDFVQPGHINPLRACDGGVLVRTGHTEALQDLCSLAGLLPAAVGIEICRPDGEMARIPDLIEFCNKHSLKMCSIEQLVEYRLQRDVLIHRSDPVDGRAVRNDYGEFRLFTYESVLDQMPHFALVKGDLGVLGIDGSPEIREDPIIVRVHRRSILDDVFGTLREGSGFSYRKLLEFSMKRISEENCGAIVYLQPDDSRAQDTLTNANAKWTERSSDSQSRHDPVQHLLGVGSQIIRNLGIRNMRLIVSRPRKLPGLGGFGLSIIEFVTIARPESTS